MINYIKRFEHNDELIKKIQWVIERYLRVKHQDDPFKFNKIFFARMGRTRLKNPKSIIKLELYEEVLEDKPIESLLQLCSIIAELEFGLDFTISPGLADYVEKTFNVVSKNYSLD
ncbi:MAG: hypothetical protein ACXITV_00220 [Luteibaculaceae bacterium]